MKDSPALDGLSTVLAIGSLLVWSWIARRMLARREPAAFEPREEVPWNGWDVAIVMAGVLLVAELARQGARIISSGASPAASEFAPTGLLGASVGEVLGLFLAVGYLIARSGATWADLGISAVKLRQDVSLGFLAFLAASLPVYGLMMWLTQSVSYEHPLVQFVRERHDTAILWLCIWSAVIVAPVAEEFLLRVVLQGWLEAYERRLREKSAAAARWPAGVGPILVSSLFFALLHPGNGPGGTAGPDQIPLFVFALFLGYLYRQTHRLAPSVVTHLCLNAVSIAQLWIMTAKQAG
jgi:membrane protease YdiL (CAAX protease family)